MSDEIRPSGEYAKLRQRAEKQIQDRSATTGSPESAADIQRLVHELHVHQIELEMQNEELRESRSQMETALARSTDLYDFAPAGYFTLTAQGNIRELNLPGARLLGRERARLIGMCFRDFVSENTQPVFDEWLKKVFASQGNQNCLLELTQQHDQTLLIVEMEATISADGRESRCVVTDITGRKVLEDQLRQAQKMEVIGRLAGGVAHDFNNILGAMMLNLEMIPLQERLPSQTLSSLHDLETLAKRAASLTQQLLLFSRQQAMQSVPLEINATLTNLLRMLDRLLGEEVSCLLIPSPRELWVDADVTMLDQAVMNLCLNARDAMPRGGTITIETHQVEFTAAHAQFHPDSRPGTFVCLRISDTGCGMDEEVLRHLFEPFFTTKEIGKGTGLGLASAYGVLRQHKGWMTVESTVGQGTSFRLYLPLLEKEVALETTPSQELTRHWQNKTILLVEDEAALLFVSTQALSMLGYQVLSATNGEDALEIWKQHGTEIDLLLTDMRMPRGMNGLELVREIRKTKPALKAIIMSGYSREVTQDTLEGIPDYTFLAKPFDVKSLSETVKHCLT